MADNLSSRGAEARYPNGDPFAELSRIIGGSPAAPTDHDEDPLDFDLERELMGSVQSAPVADRYEPAPRFDAAGVHDDYARSEPSADPLDDEFADAFAAEFGNRADGGSSAGFEPVREDVAAWEPSQPQAQDGAVLAEVDLDFGDMDISDDIPALEDDGSTDDVAGFDAPAPAVQPSMEDELAAMLASEDGGVSHSPVEPFRYSRATAVEPAPQAPAYDSAWDEPAAESEPEADRFAAWTDAPATEAPYADEADTGAVYAGSESGYADSSATYAETVSPYAEPGAPYAEPGAPYTEPSAPYGDAGTYADDAYAVGEAASYDEPAEEPAPAPAPDPFAVLAAMAPAATAFSAGRFSRPQAPAPAPVAEPEDGFETVPVAEAAVPYQDDLDLPELPPVEDEPARVQAAFDDIDFGDFSDLGAAPVQQPESPAQPAPLASDGYEEHVAGLYDDYNAPHADDALYAEYDHDQNRYEEELPAAAQAYAEEQPARRRNGGVIVAAAVLAIAIVGGIGAFAFSFGDGDNGSSPTLVRADNEPLKVRPENPGGTAVPNQDSEAYQRVAQGERAGQPQQERLVTTAEEPVRLAVPPEPSNGLPGVDEDIEAIETPTVTTAKAEDRLEETMVPGAGTGADQDILAVQPRRVRTMVVRPDGTLVPREEAAPVVVASAPESALPPAVSGGMLTAPVSDTAAPSAMPAPRAVETVRITQETAQPQPAPAVETPRAAPAAPAAAAPEPRTQVAQAAPAARPQPAAPAAPAAAPGEWSMQIASQPSAEGAQATYQDLARRYGSIIGGRGVNIVKADVPGKGTYYRVRIPSSTRAEAISLCERYKSAGGSCFVSK